MKQIKYIIITLTLILSTNVFACINEYRTLLNGEVIYTDPTSGKIWTQEIDTLELREKSNNLLLAYKRSDSIENYSDYGATLIYLGDFLKAKEVYEEIERLKPNLYTTASNLGTIYELIGEPKLGLDWIKKSIELNPNSHKGSEWIHIKILEFKTNNSNDYSNSILGLDFGNDNIPNNQNKYDLEKLKEHIWYQLRERSNFVKPKNKIVGNIYFDLGNIMAQTRDVQSALESYEASKEYGYESALMNQRIAYFKKLADKANSKQTEKDFFHFILDNFKILFWTGLISSILLIWIIIKWKRKRKANTVYKT